MPTVWNAADGRLWAAEFASGAELVQRMAGPWLAGQPGIDEVTRRAVADAVRANAAVIRRGSGRQTAVITSRSARAGALSFDGDLSTYDGTLDEVLDEFHPAYARTRTAQPAPSQRTLGGAKHGASDEWAIGQEAASPDGGPGRDWGPLGTAAGVVALAALLVVFALYADTVLAVYDTLLRLFIIGTVIWLLVRAWRWMRA